MKFIKGIFLNRKDNAPDFVIGTLSIKVDDFLGSCKQWTNDKGYINIDILEGRDGVPYLKPNTYGLNNQSTNSTSNVNNPNPLEDTASLYGLEVKDTKEDIDINDIPF